MAPKDSFQKNKKNRIGTVLKIKQEINFLDLNFSIKPPTKPIIFLA
jgi:hypothetical protein